LKKIGIAKYEKRVREIAFNWFSKPQAELKFDDIEEYTIKLTGKYMIDNNAKIKEVSLNSPIGRSIYLKSINDNDICYYVNDKKIGIKIIKRIYEN